MHTCRFEGIDIINGCIAFHLSSQEITAPVIFVWKPVTDFRTKHVFPLTVSAEFDDDRLTVPQYRAQRMETPDWKLPEYRNICNIWNKNM